MKQVLIVEDQRMPRENMERIISDSTSYELAASISSAELAVIKCQRQHIDLVLMDVCTTGSKDGIDAAAEIKKQFPNIKIIIEATKVEVGDHHRANATGAHTNSTTEVTREMLIDVIDRTMSGEHIFPDKSPVVQLGHASSAEFTAKEIEVLRLVCDGLEYSEIAEKLCVSVNTVKTHVSHILQRTGYSNKTRLAIAVTNKKFIIPSIPEDNE